MFINIADIPDDIVERYNLKAIAKNGKVYVEIRKCMYKLPQAGILAKELLQKNLFKHGYAPCKHTPGLWTHKQMWGAFLFKQPVHLYTPNRPLLNTTDVIHTAVTSAAEAEYASLYMNAKTATTSQHALIEMGHKQPPTTIQSDNTIQLNKNSVN